MEISGEQGDSVYLRGFGDYERSSLKLTASPQSGVGHLAYRTHSPEALARRVAALEAGGIAGDWIDGDLGHGRAYGFLDPDGHRIELFYESERYTAPPELRPALKNQPSRYPGRGVGVRHLDHVNFLAVDPGETRVFGEDYLGLRLTEQIVLDDGAEAGVWLASNQKSYDLTYTRDMTGTRGRLHHIAYFVDQREDVLRAADIFLEHGIVIESGPHKHAIQQTFFLYTYEPGGNRVEVCAGGFLIFDPDYEAGRVVAGGAREGPGLGHADRRLVPHQGDASRARGGRASCPPHRPLSPRPARASSCAAPTTSTSTSSRTWRSAASTTSRSPAASASSAWPASCSSRTTCRPPSARPSCGGRCPAWMRSGRSRSTAASAGSTRRRSRSRRAAVRESSGCRRSTAENEASEDGPKPAKQPVWRKIQDEFAAAGVASEPVRLTESGLARVLEVVARHDLVLATGHLGRAEIHTAFAAAREAGVAEVVITHPDYPTQGVPVGEQLALAARGAPARALLRADPHREGLLGADVRGDRARPERTTTCSRPISARSANPPVEDGLALMADRLLEAGFSEDEVHTMAVVNTRRLAGA